jgi:hypothetical protein
MVDVSAATGKNPVQSSNRATDAGPARRRPVDGSPAPKRRTHEEEGTAVRGGYGTHGIGTGVPRPRCPVDERPVYLFCLRVDGMRRGCPTDAGVRPPGADGTLKRGSAVHRGMTLVELVIATVHLSVGAVWVGSVAFFAGAVLPLARAGGIDAAPLGSMATASTRWSRASAAVMLVTGGHLAATGYTVETLASTTDGNLVVAMVVLWVALTALVEVGGSRIREGVDRKQVRQPAADALNPYRGAAVVGVALLLTAGLLVT